MRKFCYERLQFSPKSNNNLPPLVKLTYIFAHKNLKNLKIMEFFYKLNNWNDLLVLWTEN